MLEKQFGPQTGAKRSAALPTALRGRAVGGMDKSIPWDGDMISMI